MRARPRRARQARAHREEALFHRADARTFIERSYETCRFLATTTAATAAAILPFAWCHGVAYFWNDSTCGGRRPRFSPPVPFCLGSIPSPNFRTNGARLRKIADVRENPGTPPRYCTALCNFKSFLSTIMIFSNLRERERKMRVQLQALLNSVGL